MCQIKRRVGGSIFSIKEDNIMNYLDFENTETPQIITEKRLILSTAGFIEWEEETKQAKRAAFSYTLYEDKELIQGNVLLCDGVVSAFHLALYAIVSVLSLIPSENSLVIKVTQPAVINGINDNMDFWAENNWHTKNGGLVKHHDLWERIYEEKQRRRMVALELENQEMKKLQAASRMLLLQSSKQTSYDIKI
jgi:ribonuclease HI